MATSNSVFYFLSEDIDDDLQCPNCKTRFDTPKFLPCSCSVCLKCEAKLLESKNDSIQCPICTQNVNKPKNGFPINRQIQKLLLKIPREVVRGQLHQSLSKTIKELNSLSLKFAQDMNSKEAVIKDYCDLLTEKVDLKTESIIKTLNDHRDHLVCQIKNYEKQCLDNRKSVPMFNSFLASFDASYNKWMNYLEQAYLEDSELHKIQKEATLFEQEFYKIFKKLDAYIFGDKKIDFIECELNVEEKRIGYLKDSSIVSQIKSLQAQKLVRKVDYQLSGSKNNNPHNLILDFGDDKFIYISFEQSFSGTIRKVMIKLFSFDGNLIKENIETFEQECEFVQAVTVRNNLLVAYQLVAPRSYYQSNEFQNMKKYKLFDRNLKVLKHLDINYTVLHAYSSDSCEIYCIGRKDKEINFYFYNSLLNLQQIKEISDECAFKTNASLFKPANEKNAQIFIKENRIYDYIHDNGEILIFDLENFSLLNKISLNKKYSIHSSLFWLLSAHYFAIINKNDGKFLLFNTKNDCLVEFTVQITNTRNISSFFITEKGYLVLNNATECTLHVIIY